MTPEQTTTARTLVEDKPFPWAIGMRVVAYRAPNPCREVPDEEWRVVDVGVLPEGLPYFSAQRPQDGALVTFAKMNEDYYVGDIKSDGAETWFTGRSGPTPIPDLGDEVTHDLVAALP